MKSKLKLSIIIGLLSGFSTTILAEQAYDICRQIPEQPHAWNETEAKATLTGIPKDCAKMWVAYALDGSWASWYEVSFSYTPGDVSATTSTIIPSGPNWTAIAPIWPGGAASYKKPGFVAFCLWSKYNTGPKDQDCTVQIIPNSYDCSTGECKKNIPTYCTNYKATICSDGHTIKMSGLNNYSPGNWFAYSDDGWASYADITPTLAPGQDAIGIDLRNYKYVAGAKAGASVATPLTGTLDMISDYNGPNKCTADNKGGNDKNGIDVTTLPMGTGMSCTHVDYQCPPELNLSPCACRGGFNCNVDCRSSKVYVSKDMNQLIVVSPKDENKEINYKNNYTYFDRINNSTIDFQSQIYNSKSDTAIIDLSKSVYTSGALKDSLIKLPLTDTLKIYNSDSDCENKINLSTAQVWTSISMTEIYPSVAISPNPATSSETITIKGEYAPDAKVTITSVGGALVGNVIPSIGADAMTVSLAGLNVQAGIYFVRIESGEKVYVGKLCVR